MGGLDRYMNVLRLFSERKRNWTVPDLAKALEAPTSTLYRTVRELVAAGFLEPSMEANFRLGSAFVEYDRLVRITDASPIRWSRKARPSCPISSRKHQWRASPCWPGFMAIASCARPMPSRRM